MVIINLNETLFDDGVDNQKINFQSIILSKLSVRPERNDVNNCNPNDKKQYLRHNRIKFEFTWNVNFLLFRFIKIFLDGNRF